MTALAPILAGGVAALSAAVLWSAAQCAAARRGLALGGWPLRTIGGSAVTAAAIALAFPGPGAPALIAAITGTLVCATVDARTGFIFDVLTAATAIVAFALAAAGGAAADALIGATAVGGTMLALHLGTAGRGLGLGDVKLAVALALGCGMQLAALALASAFVVGAGYAIVLIARRRATRRDTLRFGPFIAAGSMVALAAGALGYRW